MGLRCSLDVLPNRKEATGFPVASFISDTSPDEHLITINCTYVVH